MRLCGRERPAGAGAAARFEAAQPSPIPTSTRPAATARLASRVEWIKLARPSARTVTLLAQRRSIFRCYKEALLFLVTAGVIAPLFFRLRISPVLGYLLAGVALGPYGLGSLARTGALACGALRDPCRSDRQDRRLRRRRAAVHDGARIVVRAPAPHAPAGVRSWPRAGRRHDARSRRRGLGARPRPGLGGDDRRGASPVLDGDRHPGARREQAARGAGRTGELLPCCCSRTSRSRRCW